MYSFELDQHTGILRANLHGHWTLAVAHRYSDELEQHIVEARRIVGCLRLIIDATEHGSQMPDVIDYVVGRRKMITQLPTDKVAICAASQLGRREAERYDDSPQSRVVPSIEAAYAWLLDRRKIQSSAG